MRKLITVLLILSLTFINVYASEIDVDRESGVIVIYGSCEPEMQVTLIMLKDGKTKDDIPHINELTFSDYVEYIDQTISDSDGNFSFVYGTQVKVSFQKFNVFLKEINENSQIEELNFVYYTKESADAMTETIIDYTTGDEISEVMNADVIALLELDTMFFDDLSNEDKNAVFDELAALTEGDSKTVRETFWEASLLKVINSIKTNDDLTKFISESRTNKIEEKVFGFKMDDKSRYSSLKDYQAMLKTNILKKTEFESISGYHEWCKTQLALTCIRCFKSTAIESVLKEFEDVLEIDVSLVEKNPNKESVYVSLAGKTFADKEEFKAAYNLAVSGSNTVVTPSPGPSSGNSGGGGGGSFGGTYNSNVVIEKPEESRPEEIKPKFSDINEEHYAFDAVEKLASQNIISGFPDGSFRPDSKVTRAEFIKMISSAFLDTEGTANIPEFTDVSENSWYKPYVKLAVSNGIVKGISETELGAENEIKREELFTMIYRVCTLKNLALQVSGEVDFTDSDEIADYAIEAVKSLSGSGIVSGYNGKITPKSVATRGECAKILYEILKISEVQK